MHTFLMCSHESTGKIIYYNIHTYLHLYIIPDVDITGVYVVSVTISIGAAVFKHKTCTVLIMLFLCSAR